MPWRGTHIANFPSTFRKDRSKDKEKLLLFRGQFTLSLSRARRGTSYKYLVVKKGSPNYEDLSEFSTAYLRDSIVNRVLKIPEKHIKAGGKLTSVSSARFHGMCQIYILILITLFLVTLLFFAKWYLINKHSWTR